MNTFTKAIDSEFSWTKTMNGADALNTTLNKCLDLFGRGGSMRNASILDKEDLFRQAFEENPDIAIRLLFYIRDIRGGYGERDTFLTMLTWLANNYPDSVNKNLWAILEYGRAKDLYSLIGTKSEEAMWKFMKDQFESDIKNMNDKKNISLLAKWIATPDASSTKTAMLGKKTAKMLGYDYTKMRQYKRHLRALRKYLDITEIKMSTNHWSDIEYSNVPSQCLIKCRQAFINHDEDRYNDFIYKANNGEVKMNTSTMTPCDIIHNVAYSYTPDLDTMWSNLKDYCKGNALVMCDTSGSMTWSAKSIRPIDVATSLSLYFAERNKGPLKNVFMTFESNPHLIKITGNNLYYKYKNINNAPWGGSTDLESAFNYLLKICKNNNVCQEDMPDALIIISDMQINSCVHGFRDNKITFYNHMKNKYENAGYKLPQLVFWNVDASIATFHASASQDGAFLVSGYSPSVFTAVMSNIGKNPLDLMFDIINSKRYSNIFS